MHLLHAPRRAFGVLAIGLALLLWAPLGGAAADADVDAAELVRRAEDALRGQTAQMRASMQIETPRWQRSVVFRSWDDRAGDRSFTRILEPAKDRGSAFLRLGDTFWTYLPRVERTTRLPPSMMLQSWMGSDFSNDDLARESSMSEDYTAKAIGEREMDGVAALGVELVPKPEAPVVWAKVEVWVAKASYAPLLFLYYDEPDPGRFELLRRLHFADIKTVKGRPVPHRWTMESVDKPGHRTTIRLDEIALDDPIAADTFSQGNLKKGAVE